VCFVFFIYVFFCKCVLIMLSVLAPHKRWRLRLVLMLRGGAIIQDNERVVTGCAAPAAMVSLVDPGLVFSQVRAGFRHARS